jgi:hypothetical protein
VRLVRPQGATVAAVVSAPVTVTVSALAVDLQ